MQRIGVIVLSLSALLVTTPAQAAYNVIYFTSTPDSWIGQGLTMTIDSVSVFRDFSNAVNLSGGGYILDVVGPNMSLLTVGSYDDAIRWPFMGSSPGLWFSAPGRGDNTLTGWFDVLQADYASDGTVLDFAVNFQQFDDTSTTAWTAGEIRYNSSIPIPEPLAAAPFMLCAPALLRRHRHVPR